MKPEHITEGLRELLRRQKQLRCDVDAITLETRFDQLGFDSLSILDFMYEVEERFGVQPDMAELVRMRKVEDLIQYLHARIQE